MKIKLVAAFFVVGALLGPLTVHADGDSDRSHPMAFVKDSVITAKVKAKLAEAKMSSLAHVHVDTDAQGAVVLSGRVKTQKTSDRAASIAGETEGVTSVKNLIHVKSKG